MIEVVLGFLFTIACGSYGWTYLVFKWLYVKIDKIETNHLEHVHEDIKQLKARVKSLEGVDCPYKEEGDSHE